MLLFLAFSFSVAQVVTINGIMGDGSGNFNISEGSNTQISNVQNVTIDTNSNITVTTLDITATTLPSTNTTCLAGALAASCVDGSLAPSCTIPITSACLPANYTVQSMTVTGTVNATNAYITLMQNQTGISTNALTTSSTIVQGSATCSRTFNSNCFDVSGYMCAINQTLPSNCYPSTRTFTNATVTNTLRIGTLVCTNGPMTNTSCLPTRVFSINGINATNFTIIGTNGINVAGTTISVNGTNSVVVQDQVVTTINFLGTATVTASGSTTNVNINSPLTVQKNSVSVGTPSTINFVGGNIAASGGNPTNVYVRNAFRPGIRNVFGPTPGANISVGGYISMNVMLLNDGGSASTLWDGWRVSANSIGFLTLTYTTAVGSVQLCPRSYWPCAGTPPGVPNHYVCGTVATPTSPGVLHLNYWTLTACYFTTIINNGPTYWVPGANDRLTITHFTASR